MKKGFITNKYTLSVIILLAILATDILLHKGMSRVILPQKFTGKRQAQPGIPQCGSLLEIKGRRWAKDISSIELANTMDSTTNGFEMDVYFDTSENIFLVNYDSTAVSKTNAADIFSAARQKGLTLPVWINIENLEEHNTTKSLQQLLYLENRYGLQHKMLVTSGNAMALKVFCDSGFYTGYQVPFFNPYSEKEEVLIARIDSISSVLKKYPVSALSAYYFQIPFLKKFFPAFPLLTFTEDSRISLVNNYFNYHLEKDKQVHIVLHNIDN